MPTDITFFQHGDEPDAANFALGVGVMARRGFIASGLGLSDYDDDEPSIVIEDGVCVIWRGEYETSHPDIDPPETRMHTAHPVEVEGEEHVLDEETTNYMWVDANVNVRNNPLIEHTTENEPPSDVSLKIGEVDTTEEDASDAVSEQWSFITQDGTLTFPDADALSEVAEDLWAGTKVYDRETETYYKVS